MNEFIVSTGSGNKVISSDNGSRDRVSRKGSRKGYTMDWDGIDYEAIAGKLENLGEDPWGLDFDDLFDLAESKGLTPDQFEREGSSGDDIVQKIIDQFDEDEINHDKLIALAKELPQGKDEDVIIALGVGAWRGDEPEEEEFFRIIDSKY